ncbi:MAG: hypothetical protein MUF73_03770 [Rhodobacteraceae bacterium]|jgi:hypothetical protein|nr:hypothetical protein [Paracoccaceae bacterium]
MRRAAFALVLCAAPVAAQDVRYSANCGAAFDDGLITLSGDMLLFHESQCRITNAVAVPGMEGAALADLVCAGEGEEWTDRAFLQPSFDGGLILVRGGFALMLPRCP